MLGAMPQCTIRTNPYLRLLIVVAVVALAGCAAPDPLPAIEDQRLAGSEALIRALDSDRPERRVRAALAMGRIQHPSYAEPLAAASRSDDLELQAVALFALGQLGLAEGLEPPVVAVEACRDALAAADPRVVAAAAEALGKLAPPGTADALAPLLRHADESVRTEAALGLFRYRFAPTWRGELDEAPPLPPAAREALLQAFDDPAPAVRRAACYGFSRYGEPAAVERLTGLLADEDAWVRLFAARALARAADESAAAALVPLLDDPSLHVRTESVVAVAALGGAALLPPGLSADPSFHVRVAYAGALAAATDAASLEQLRALELDDSPAVRAAAVDALSRRLGEAYLAGLDQHLDAGAWPVRVAALRAAGRLEEGALPLLQRGFDDPDARVKAAALAAGGNLPGAESILLRGLESDDLALRGTAVGLLAEAERADKLELLAGAYDDAAGDEWIEVREAIVDALPADEAAQALLRRAASEDAAWSVRSKARLALAGRGIDLPDAAAPPIDPSPWLGQSLEQDPTVVLETSKGTLAIRCLADEAPIHVAAFVQRVGEGFYDGLPWHRVVPNFVVQGGDPRGDGWGTGDTLLRDEINRTRYTRGTLGMPKAGKDTGGCQLFLTHIPTPHLDGNYTVFGQVVEGLDVIDALEMGDEIVRAYVR